MGLLGQETVQWGGGLPREGVGVKNFVFCLENPRDNRHDFSGISQEFCQTSRDF